LSKLYGGIARQPRDSCWLWECRALTDGKKVKINFLCTGEPADFSSGQ
jgi:hypothetical protein